jgi:glutathione synthase/RimK-type ligase-like ATP-grasp enzyme
LLGVGLGRSVCGFRVGPDDRAAIDWNYPIFPREFLRWVKDTSMVSELWNPPAVVRWNLHKKYLFDLAKVGLAIAPTQLVERGSTRRLADIAAERGWAAMVVKPAISASSMDTLKVGEGDFDRGEIHLRTIAADRDVLVQEYLSSVEGYGERALVWIDGVLTHGVRKSPRFVDDGESVSAEPVEIRAAEATLARRAVQAVRDSVTPQLVYARIDLAPGPNGLPVIMELELIEPSLYFAQSAFALETMVGAIASRIPEAG